MKRFLATFLISGALFASSASLFDGDLARYPFVVSGKGAERQKTAVIDTVRSFNMIFSDFYASGGVPALLDEFPATKEMRHLLFRDIGFIGDARRVLVYDMAGMTPIDAAMTSFDRAEVVMFEEWNYLYQGKEDRRPVSRIKGLGQGYRYFLVRSDGRWVVRAWDPVVVEERGKSEFLF